MSNIGPLLIPDAYNIFIDVQGTRANLEHRETYRRHNIDKEKFREIIENTKEAGANLGINVVVNWIDDDTVEMYFTLENVPFSQVADSMVMEFLPSSNVGKMSLGELLAKMYILSAKEGVEIAREKFYEKLKEVNEGKYDKNQPVSGITGELEVSTDEDDKNE